MYYKSYSNKEINTILDNAHLPMNLTLWQGLRVSLWLIFNYKKLSLFCWHLENGKPAQVAYFDTINGRPL